MFLGDALWWLAKTRALPAAVLCVPCAQVSFPCNGDNLSDSE